ncbi:MAG: hypothetical protein NZ869_09925 [Thermoanaerobaculum sp.]|nr:hypothetical protein [Thermoanaerobaculum sp.]MDW7967144.1 hypothetical protein [Thermoanaerobaculum sp.]
MHRASVLNFLALVAVPLAVLASDHRGYFQHYEGTKTCLACHEQEAKSFFHSQLYRWRGQATNVVNANEKYLGKMNTIDDFCTNPQTSSLGVVSNPRGDVVSKGCSRCHAGFGLPPVPKKAPSSWPTLTASSATPKVPEGP